MTRPQALSARDEWRSYWTIILAALIGYSMVAVPSITLGLFMEPVTREFGWSRAEFSYGLLVVALVTTPLVPFAGALADRFGARRVALPGTALHALALAAFGLMMPSLWLWMAAWAVYAVMQLSIRSMIWTGAISAAFVAGRGMALAVFMSGTALAQVLGPLATRWLIDEHGWRNAFFAIAAVWGGLGFVLVALFFRDLRQGGSKQAAQSAPVVQPGLSLAQALRDWRLIRITFAMSIVSLIASGFMIHLVPMLTGGGMDRSAATQIIALTGFTALAGQLAAGFLLDRIKGFWLAPACFAMPALGFLALMPLIGGALLPVALTILFISLGTGTALNITIYLVSRYAGLRHFGAIFGVVSSCMGLVAGGGPLLAGWIFDSFGSYEPFLWIAAGGAALAGAALLRLGPYPVFEPVQPGESEPAPIVSPAA
jgi:predicted MFS family arabinose efflux permease